MTYYEALAKQIKLNEKAARILAEIGAPEAALMFQEQADEYRLELVTQHSPGTLTS
jgi:hypothetical protein